MDVGLRLLSAGGLVCMLVVAWVMSENRRRPPWRIIGWGMGLQLLFGLLVMRTGAGGVLFSGVNRVFDLLTSASAEGAAFMFGNLSRLFILDSALTLGPDGEMVAEAPFVVNAIMAFNVLPVIIFVAGVAAMLQHLGVIQAVVRAMAWLMRRTLKTSGAETFGSAMLVFVGIEGMPALGGYLKNMTRSELFTVMTAFLSTVAANVMVAYAGFGAEPGHLLAASLMSAPAAIAIAKIMIPESQTPETTAGGRFTMPVESENLFDAAARGSALGLNMALHVGAVLIVFVGLIHWADQGALALTGLPANTLLGYLFRPFAFVMGVPLGETPLVAELLATKTIFNEFIAYENMQGLIAEGALSRRSVTIATYALCGFANPGSLGILIGGLAAIIPGRRGEIARLTGRAFVAGTLATFATACVAGALAQE